jgi:hypothetical protein
MRSKVLGFGPLGHSVTVIGAITSRSMEILLVLNRFLKSLPSHNGLYRARGDVVYSWCLHQRQCLGNALKASPALRQTMEPHEAGESGPNKVPVADGGREITLETLVHATALTVGKHEQLSHFLKRVTHLKLQGDASAGGKGNNRGKMIRRLQNLHHCPNLQVLYLYDNEVEAIETLEQDVPQLSHLYLQNNRVREMRGLAGLQQLEKLFLSGNRIARLEGFANGGGWNLQELHLSNQSLSPSVTFSFDQDTLQSLSVRRPSILSCGLLFALGLIVCYLLSGTAVAARAKPGELPRGGPAAAGGIARPGDAGPVAKPRE